MATQPTTPSWSDMGAPWGNTTDPLTQTTADELNVAPTDKLNEDVQTARALVAQELGTHAERVPPMILAKAIIKCACELFEQRKAPSGVRNFADADGAVVVRIARDPMTGARPILAPFLPLATS